MITRIEATRYRCFEKLDVALGDFRVLVGANGSGKTTLLDIPVLLGDMLEARTIGDAFLGERDHRAPRASGFRELIFRGKGDFFILAIEAALLAAGRAPGLLRSNYGFAHWKGFDPAAIASGSAKTDMNERK